MLPIPPMTAAVNAFEPRDEAHEVVDALEHEPDHDACRARERGADEERHDDHAVDVDSHHRRRLPVVSGRAHRLAEPRAGDEEREPDHQRSGGDDDDDANQRDVQRPLVDALDEERAAAELERVVGAEIGREEQQRRVLEKERHAERRDQRCDPRRVPQRPVGEALDDDAEQPGPDHRREEHERDHQPDREHRIRGAARDGEHAVADEGADHVDLAVGEVQELEDPVHHRVAKRDQRVHAAEREPVDQLLNEEVPGVHQGMCAARECGPHTDICLADELVRAVALDL